MSTAADEWFPKHRINVDEYYRMSEGGLLAREARVESIQGKVTNMAPIGSKHAATVNMLNWLLVRAIDGRAIVAVQQPIRLGGRSELQPDIALLKPRADFYSATHPTATDVLLLIEVSDVALHYDRDIKLPLYASYGIPEVWLIDIDNKQMHWMDQPINQAYAAMATLHGGTIELKVQPGTRIDLSSVLNL